jgi:diguanylate cyclase (GGDEF)-like protein
MRWGGEEFLLVYTTTDKKQLISEAERLRSIFEKNRYRCKDQTMNFTLTVGSTLYHPMEESFTVALARADRALYRGKQAGKNCVKYLES